ncbi:MAG: peroxiredoxin [Alphaproteobacteria bacterium]|nr:peroxiredoxin [Alphaproteobacteria bacterium]
MTIQPGDKLPSSEFSVMYPDGFKRVSGDEIFAGKRVVLFAVPGAFTPTCTKNHLPGFLEHADRILAKGVDTIACTAVNDVHVMNAWSISSGNTDGKIMMLADGNATFARSIGLNRDMSAANFGERSQRYSMLVEDGVVKILNLEDKPGLNVSDAGTILGQL